jgi:hypothetical protein
MGAYENTYGLPLVAITNTSQAVAYNVTTFTIAGTNNPFVVGSMWWQNAGTADEGTLAAAAAWTIPDIPLAEGDNVITVSGSNDAGAVSSDQVTISRAYSMLPVVDVTNTAYRLVAHDDTTVPVAGTNTRVVGTMWWSTDQGASGTLTAADSWLIPAVPLAIGQNLITIGGSNAYGDVDTDTCTVERDQYSEPRPYVDVTNETIVVGYDVTAATIGGTNNPYVVGTMDWSSSMGPSGTIPASEAWTITAIPLSVGANIITVVGSNIVGVTERDSVTITRLDQPGDEPFVDILTPGDTVPYETTTYTISGTNNPNVVGQLDYENYVGFDLVDSGSIPAVSPWTISNILLDVGDNEITVWAQNAGGDEAWDSITVTRLAPREPEIQEFTISLAADFKTPVLSWSNTTATILVCTNSTYCEDPAEWFAKTTVSASSWQDDDARDYKAVFYKLVTANETSAYALGKLSVPVYQSDGYGDAQNWIASPFDFVDDKGATVDSMTFDALGLPHVLSDEYRAPSARDAVYSQNGIGGATVYATRGWGQWYAATDVATNWYRDRMYRVFIRSLHTGNPKSLTFVGRVPTNNPAHAGAVVQSDGNAHHQNWCAAWYPWNVGFDGSGINTVVNTYTGSPARRDAVYSRPYNNTVYATRGDGVWHTDSPNATNLYPGCGYIILIKKNHTGAPRDWYVPRAVPMAP